MEITIDGNSFFQVLLIDAQQPLLISKAFAAPNPKILMIRRQFRR